MQISVTVIACAVTGYVLASLWGWLIARKPAFNMNRMLHRGKYAIKGEHGGEETLPPTGLKAILPSKEFSRLDKFLYYALMVWMLGFTSIFIGVTVYQFIWGTTDAWWVKFWGGFVWLSAVLGVGTIVWFLIGGIRDARNLFRTLKTVDRTTSDDGRVVGHHSAADEVLEADNPEVVAELKEDRASGKQPKD